MNAEFFVGSLKLAVLGLAMVGTLPAPLAKAQTEIPLAPGDTISFSVIGAPELEAIAVIGPDGRIQLPAAGWIKAAGLTIDTLRAEVESAVSNRPYRLSGAPGEESWRRVSPEDLVVDVDAYRPVYLMGDVRFGGEIAFRPGLTLRQAVARAGGLGTPPELHLEPLQLLELASKRDLVESDISFAEATLDRLEADLAAIGAPDPQSSGPPSSGDTTDHVAERWLKARDAERRLSESNSDLRLEQIRNRLKVLQTLQKNNKETMQTERRLLARQQNLVERGIAPSATLIDARRGVLQTSIQHLETSSEIYRLQLDLARTSDEARRLQAAQRVHLLERIADQQAGLASLRQQLSSINTRITVLGSQVARALDDVSYRYEVFRETAPAPIVTSQITDRLMLPGDVVTVTMFYSAPYDGDLSQ
ncbi:MAG: polysaccharide biosynthesis/export family protein [Pseudomonadota bacterium]